MVLNSGKQMKKLILLFLLSLSIVGCKSTSHTNCGTQSNGVTKPVLILQLKQDTNYQKFIMMWCIMAKKTFRYLEKWY
jgi:hypothetical protein